MCLVAPGPFNMAPKVTNMATSKPSPQECFGSDQNYYLSTVSSRIMGDKKVVESEACRGMNNRTICNSLEAQSCTNNYVRNLCERPQISYSEAVNRGLTINTLRPKYP